MTVEPTHYEDLQRVLRGWRKRTLAVLWVAYAAFYLCRVNLAASQKDLAAEQGLSKDRIGLLLGLMKGAYACGQFINGMLADRLGPRKLITAGLVSTAGLNLVFAHLSSFGHMAATWAGNGYVQSLGWTSVVRTLANWFPPRLRDATSGFIGTSYILGSGLSWLLAGWVTEHWGWRQAFWTPGWVCLGVGAVFFVLVRERPEQVGLPATEQDAPNGPQPQGDSRSGLRTSLMSPRLWRLAVANASLLFGYHGLLDWTPHFLAESGNMAAGVAAQRAFWMPVGGTIGCLCVMGVSRRSGTQFSRVMVPALLCVLAGLTYSFPWLVRNLPGLTSLALLGLGAFSAGPAALMACAMPANISGAESAGTAAGVVDAAGYVGSAASGWASGRIMESVGKGQGRDAAWSAVWRVWPAGMLCAAVLVALAGDGQKCSTNKTRKDTPTHGG